MHIRGKMYFLPGMVPISFADFSWDWVRLGFLWSPTVSMLWLVIYVFLLPNSCPHTKNWYIANPRKALRITWIILGFRRFFPEYYVINIRFPSVFFRVRYWSLVSVGFLPSITLWILGFRWFSSEYYAINLTFSSVFSWVLYYVISLSFPSGFFWVLRY